MSTLARISVVALAASFLAMLHASVGVAGGNTLYVKASGSDYGTSCTAADPCRSIQRAVTVAANGDTIQVGNGTFDEKGGLTVDKDVTIAGSGWLGTRVTQDPLGQAECCTVVRIQGDAHVKVSDLMITGGNGGDAGGIDNYGGLTLNRVYVLNNRSNDLGAGAAIINHGTGSLATSSVAVTGNFASAGLRNLGVAIIVDSRFVGTHGAYGGGDGIASAGGLIVSRGLFAGNEAHGLSTWNPFGSSAPGCPTTWVANATFNGNGHNGIDAECGGMTLIHVTVTANGAYGIVAGGSIVLRNSIVATNGGSACAGILADVSYSLVGDSSCKAWPTPDNLVGVDPKLGPLAYHVGGPLGAFLLLGATRARAPLAGSPVIDKGSNDFSVFEDQLGHPRPVDGNGDGNARNDMGAYEYRPPGGVGTEG